MSFVAGIQIRMWRDVLDSLNDAVVVMSPQLDILLTNPAADALLGSQINRDVVRTLLSRIPGWKGWCAIAWSAGRVRVARTPSWRWPVRTHLRAPRSPRCSMRPDDSKVRSYCCTNSPIKEE